MFKNLLTVAIRSIQRQRFFAFIHILGLSLGIMVCITIALYTSYELQYDKFHSNAERIYRINQTFIWGDDDALFGSTGPAVVHALREEVPEFEALTRAHPTGPQVISRSIGSQPIVFEEEKVLAVDENFLEIFTFPLLQGDQSTALSSPNSIILTKETAKKYFKDQEALGEYLEIGEGADKKSYKVTGITTDVPPTSHIEFDFLISMTSLPNVADRRDSWMWTTFVTFGLLREDANPTSVADKVAAVPGKYLEAFLQKYRGISYQEFIASGEEWDLYIQPLLDIHLRSTNVYSRLNQVGNIQNIYVLWGIGSLILILSLINFINLSTAKSASRAKEVGIRKVIGSGRSNLIYQFLTESLIYVVASVLIGFFLTELILPFFNGIVDTELTTSTMLSPIALLTIVFSTLLVGMLGGLYPAFYLSSFQPAKVLKGKLSLGLKDGKIRNILVTAQFAISITMIACTLIVKDQVSYWMNYDLGFDKENKIIVEHVNRLGSESQMETYRNELLSNPKVKYVSIVSDTPPMIFDFDNFKRRGDKDYNLSVNYLTADESFIPSFDIQLIEGRGLEKSFFDSTNIVVNEYFVKAFGFESNLDAIGEDIQYHSVDFKIVGVMNDFNTSLSQTKYPVAILDHSAPIFRNPQTKMVVDLNESATSDEIQDILNSAESKWQTITAKSPFSYTFADQEYAEIFTQTINFGKLLTAFSILAVIIACLGLFGLVAYVIEKRTKEIGVRKVLGATVANIWMMLSSDFGRLLLVGFIIAAPLSWYMMSRWIQNYELRTDISLFTIFMAGLLMVLIAVLSTSIQTIKASRLNPVDQLKEE
ncbi:ABC transporter permease [Marinoscillum pacificum]|uniref:ABC transporter permease n=1 Tax=Marinoscillum pacificum TaxID=392723 RepID=UPI00215841F7|nr:ABC transporter permease [Marinoscillum pacificum]